MGSSLVFGLGLLTLSVGLAFWNVFAWRLVARATQDEQWRAFERRQLRRRIQTSTAIGLIGVAVIFSIWINRPLAAAFYWLGVLLAVLWIVYSGLSDILGSRSFYQRLRDQHLAQNVELRAQLEKIRRRDANGQKNK